MSTVSTVCCGFTAVRIGAVIAPVASACVRSLATAASTLGASTFGACTTRVAGDDEPGNAFCIVS